jgi:diguanylate cyclase (GGDEF)-like protein/putative nucleotidyltransferase with HDIG domain
MVDLNGLKIFNDAFGHDVGDEVLKTLATILLETFRSQDVVCRIGGDEFAIILPRISTEEIETIINNVKNRLTTINVNNINVSAAIGYKLKTNDGTQIDETLKFAENSMYRNKLAEGKSVRNQAIQAILQSLTDKHESEKIHSMRVSQISMQIGQAMKLKKAEILKLELAGLFHDIGKIAIPEATLNKPGKFTYAEYEVIKTHSEIGYQILRAADEYSDLAIHALSHHERWDGKGYPRGLDGENIPLFSRIICIADAFEAMTSDRKYRKKVDEQTAAKEIIKYSGTQFDPEIAKIFVVNVLGLKWE